MQNSYTYIAIFIFSIFGIASCDANPTTVNDAEKQHSDGHQAQTASVKTDPAKAFQVDFTTEPGVISAGAPATLGFTVRDRQGAVVRDLPIVHEKPMHLLVVSKDLEEFYHIHPEQSEDGSYRVTHTFPHGGEYRLYADFTPKDSGQIVERLEVTVSGAERNKAALAPDPKLEKIVEGLRVVMTPDAEIKAGRELMLNFQVFDAASGKPATDLQNYLGELAHFVIISEDLKDFVHAHPMSKGEHSKMSGNKPEAEKAAGHNADNHSHSETTGGTAKPSASEVSAHTAFPRTGLYKVWAQFQRGGRVITVPFTVRAAEGGTAAAVKDASVPPGAIKVTVSGAGYEPAEIKVEKGKPAKLAFYRADADNCGGEVIFPALNISKKISVGETVLVEFTPLETGEIAFNCGMNMMKGKIIAN